MPVSLLKRSSNAVSASPIVGSNSDVINASYVQASGTVKLTGAGNPLIVGNVAGSAGSYSLSNGAVYEVFRAR